MDQSDKDKDQANHDDKGFAVHDKRRIGKDGAPETGYTAPESTGEPAAGEGPRVARSGMDTGPEAGQAADKPSPEAGPRTGERDYMPLTFTSFIMSLSTSALIYLGQIPDPVSGNTVTDVVGARQTIDLIALLKEKTSGNLTPDETTFIDGVRYDLRMLFVKANS